jgi:hypothetical protein
MKRIQEKHPFFWPMVVVNYGKTVITDLTNVWITKNELDKDFL